MENSNRPDQNQRPAFLSLLLLILAGESIFFLPFVLVRIFRPTVLQVYEITNLELGQCFSFYGITALASYLVGGPIADRFSNRKLIAISLVATAAGGVVLSLKPTLEVMYWVYGYWGVTTILLFWAPLLRSTRLLGGNAFQGRSFGGLEGGRGLMAAILGTLGTTIFALGTGDTTQDYQTVLWCTIALVAGIGLLAWLVLPEGSVSEGEEKRPPVAQMVLDAAGNKQLWLLSGIVLCAYVGYKITDDYSLYANEVLGFSELNSARVSSGALWLRPVFALLAGFLVDRYTGWKVIALGFGCVVLGGSMIASGWVASIPVLTLLIMGFSLLGVYGLRGIYFAVFKSASVPGVATGTAVGIVSIMGYTPDIFMSPLMGYLLDNNPGETGHQLVFAVLAGFGLLGLVFSAWFGRASRLSVNEKRS